MRAATIARLDGGRAGLSRAPRCRRSLPPVEAVVDGAAAAVLRRIVDLFGLERSARAARRERILRPAQAGCALRDDDVAADVPDERLAVAAALVPPARPRRGGGGRGGQGRGRG